jgi:hypothetical protein
MKKLITFFLIVCIYMFSCKKDKSNESIVYDGSIIVHTQEPIGEDYGGWILISDDKGNLIGEQVITNNTMIEVKYQIPSNGNINVTLFELKLGTSSPQGTDSYIGHTYTNVTDSILYFNHKPNESFNNYETVAVDFDDNIGELKDVIVTSGLTSQAKHLGDFNPSFNSLIKVPDNDPNILVAILKADEDFWRYGFFPTTGMSSLFIVESELIYQSTISNFETDFETKNWSVRIDGLKEIDDVTYVWNLFWNQGSDSGNAPPTDFTYIAELNLISSLNEFSRYRTGLTLQDNDNNVFYTKQKIGELDFSFNPTPIAFQTSQIDAEHLKVENLGLYSHFHAVWFKSTELSDGIWARGTWLVHGEFQEDFKLPNLPDFALNTLPEELTCSPIPLIQVTGFEDSRYNTYYDFQEDYLYNQSADSYYNSIYPDYSEDVIIKGTTIEF